MNENIRLIATDIDGTLVKESSPNITGDQVRLFRALCDKGINICVASGRQFGSVRKVFAPVDREMFYIVENGAHILKGNETLSCTPMKREQVEGIMKDLRGYYPDGCHVVASTTEGCFLESRDDAFIRLMKDGYRNDVTLTGDVLDTDARFVKIAVYRKGSIRQIGENNLIPKWKDEVKATMAGEEWVDFMDASVDKGNGLEFLMNYLSLTPDQVIAFGDNENDIGMLLKAGTGYAVGNAVDKVKTAAAAVCPPYWEQGVDKVLEELL